MSKKILFLFLLGAFSASAFAGFLKEGAYLGEHNGRDCVDLLVKPAPGRAGSFFAVLMKDDGGEKMSLYMLDEINASSYSMTPLEVTRDGEIGVVNDDPSLVITAAQGSNGQDIFKIMSANSSNNNGFTGFFEFSGKSSKYSWLEITGGEYSNDGKSNALQISSLDSHEREAAAVFLTSDLNGTFTLREKFPSMYLINQNSVLATGTTKNKIPSAIGIFLQKKGVFGSKKLKMVLINPKNDTDLKTFSYNK